ncbi:MAG: nitroreductase family protein [Bacteroidales bacterium]|jgi:nitroreductase|nr:nitroreductase family protein [Bacteroidales bacterium]MCU0408869.1 nitroreductase family protein [Bacteroidales bacterium]
MVSGPEILELIRKRQSDRKYDSRPVEKEKLDRIIEAGRLAPSACNAQPWKFIVADDAAICAELADAASARLLGMNTFVSQAPVLIVIVREQPNFTSKIGGQIKQKDYSLIDIGIAAENICLQAEAEGLGSCMLGWFDEPRAKKILGIPKTKRVELIITIGYPLGEKREKRRKAEELTVSYNKY